MPVDLIQTLLQQHPQGLSEYQLMQLLREQQIAPFSKHNLQKPLSLFQSHFILFNALYRLRDQLSASQTAALEIHTLNIRLRPWQTGEATLCQTDKLRAYYLDIRHLETTDHSAVEALLSLSTARLHQQTQAQEALELLGFSTALAPDAEQIRMHYRRLVSQHHPDRGGSTQQVQQFNQALALLKTLGYLG